MLLYLPPMTLKALSHPQDALVARVASANSRTIVVVNSVGAIEMESWVNHPNGARS